MIKALSVSALLFLLLAACAPAPTIPPTSTDIALPPLPTLDGTIPPVEPSAVPTGPESALEAILLALPGAGSRLTSPVSVQGQSRPTFEQNLVIAIYGQEGEELALQPTTIQAPMGEPGGFSAEIAFVVTSEQPGRISVFETSALDGGIVHLSSAEVTLLPGGEAQVIPAEFHFEVINITAPAALAQVSGGQIEVSGFSDYFFESNLGLALCGPGGEGAPHELCGTEDNVLALSFATIQSPDIGQPGPFSGQLSYTVSEPGPARIVVYAQSARDGGLLHLSSIPITLAP
ncbi:MAG: hypothetical protein KIS80_02610 [Anaerolineales bacterium]|nr:hypothetical protein [Anaerolineales bacterium]